MRGDGVEDAALRHLAILAAIGAAIGLLAALARIAVVRDDARPFGTLAAGLLVGVGASWGLDTMTWPWPWRAAMILVATFVGGDVAAGVALLGKQLRADPLGFPRIFWASLRGGIRPPDERP